MRCIRNAASLCDFKSVWNCVRWDDPNTLCKELPISTTGSALLSPPIRKFGEAQPHLLPHCSHLPPATHSCCVCRHSGSRRTCPISTCQFLHKTPLKNLSEAPIWGEQSSSENFTGLVKIFPEVIHSLSEHILFLTVIYPQCKWTVFANTPNTF